MSLEIIKIAHLSAHTGSVYAICNTLDNSNSFYSAGGDGMVIRWNVQEPDKAFLAAKVNSNIFSISGMPPQYLLLGQMQGGIHVIDLHFKKEIKNLAFHKNGVFDIQLAGDGKVFFAAGGDGIISLWDTEEFALLKNKQVSDKSIRALVVDEVNQKIYTGSSDNRIYVLDYKTFEIINQWEAHSNSVFSLCLSPCGKYLLSGSRDAYLTVWLIAENYRLLQSQPAHLFTINHIVYSPDGKYFATAGRDKHIKIWSAENFQLLKVIDKEKYNGHVNSVNRLMWNDEYLISCSDDRTVMVWKVVKHN
jgi:WD40 repeat protein